MFTYFFLLLHLQQHVMHTKSGLPIIFKASRVKNCSAIHAAAETRTQKYYQAREVFNYVQLRLLNAG